KSGFDKRDRLHQRQSQRGKRREHGNPPGAVVILLFVYRDVEYSKQLWWQFELTAEAPRGLRAVLGITIISSAIAVFSLLRPASFRP
ncbi:hypothetical protein ACC756_38140, partial [Rhizobium ruizarguesonis]